MKNVFEFKATIYYRKRILALRKVVYRLCFNHLKNFPGASRTGLNIFKLSIPNKCPTFSPRVI
jgi:hypothetical protein